MGLMALNYSKPAVVYPETDGEPIAENTLQFEWITTIMGGLTHLFDADPNVFVAADLFWYPVEGDPGIRVAPDTMVAFGRPKGHRPSYLQWEEDGIAPQVVFEILSPGNRVAEMVRKFEFYQKYGVEEYYIYDPDPPVPHLEAFVRSDGGLIAVENVNGFISPRLGIRFDMNARELRIYRPDGRQFLTSEQIYRLEEGQRQQLDQERQRADEERQRADEAVRAAEQLRARLRALGQDVD